MNSDCCPDYFPVCRGLEPHPILKCFHKGQYFTHLEPPIQDNCNLCRCTSNGITTCELDLCLTDDALVHNVQQMAGSWQPKNYSEFWGRKYDEGLLLRTGTFEPTRHVKAMSRLTNRRMQHLKQNFDAREEWSGLVAEPEDQGWCGSSWVMSTTSVSSDRFAIQSKSKEIVQLAPQQLLSCIRKQQGCRGGHLDVAWSYLRKTGTVDEECMPYLGRKGKCGVRPGSDTLKSLGCTLPTKVPRKELYKMGPAYALNNETDIMIEIQASGPVQATMRVYRDFFTYGSGIYKHSPASRSDPRGFHSVKLVGWGDEGGVKYWVSNRLRQGKVVECYLILNYLFRLLPTPGDRGGAKMATSESKGATTNAKLKTMSWLLGPMCTELELGPEVTFTASNSRDRQSYQRHVGLL